MKHAYIYLYTYIYIYIYVGGGRVFDINYILHMWKRVNGEDIDLVKLMIYSYFIN